MENKDWLANDVHAQKLVGQMRQLTHTTYIDPSIAATVRNQKFLTQHAHLITLPNSSYIHGMQIHHPNSSIQLPLTNNQASNIPQKTDESATKLFHNSKYRRW